MFEPGPTVETTSVRHAALRDRLVIGVAVVAVVLVLVKPWGQPATAEPRAPRPIRTAAPTAAPTVRAHVSVPSHAFGPAPNACYSDSGWAVCLLDLSDGRRIQSSFRAGSATAPVPSPVPQPTVPAVLLLTVGGGGLGFYAPPGTAIVAGALMAVAAWRVDEVTTGTRSLSLESVGPLGAGVAMAPNVFVPALDLAAPRGQWPNGRYVVRFQAGGDTPWEQYFALEVTAPEAAPGHGDTGT